MYDLFTNSNDKDREYIIEEIGTTLAKLKKKQPEKMRYFAVAYEAWRARVWIGTGIVYVPCKQVPDLLMTAEKQKNYLIGKNQQVTSVRITGLPIELSKEDYLSYKEQPTTWN
jgi:hypothetical protein